MYDTEKCRELKAGGYVGGIIPDEMTIQEDLQIDNAGGSNKFSGATETDDDGDIVIQQKRCSQLMR